MFALPQENLAQKTQCPYNINFWWRCHCICNNSCRSELCTFDCIEQQWAMLLNHALSYTCWKRLNKPYLLPSNSQQQLKIWRRAWNSRYDTAFGQDNSPVQSETGLIVLQVRLIKSVNIHLARFHVSMWCYCSIYLACWGEAGGLSNGDTKAKHTVTTQCPQLNLMWKQHPRATLQIKQVTHVITWPEVFR